MDSGVVEPYDHMIMEVQEWLNERFKNDLRYERVPENGKTGWPTIYGLRRGLQIIEGIPEASNSFGPETYARCPNVNQGEEGDIVRIIQGGLWCKGYNPGGFNGYYGPGTYAAVKSLKSDMGFPTASGNMNKDIMRGLLDMSAFVIPGVETAQKLKIREVQQKLNYNYYDYYQICPCDGSYNRDMNKMLMYALQKELKFSKSEATGSWGPQTIIRAKEKSFSIGDKGPIVELIRYATICNGYTDIASSSDTYDAELDTALEEFSKKLLIEKPSKKVNYTVFKSLLSSNGDTDRAAQACDTATKLTPTQIQTIKDAGYKIVGRYITNTPGGKLDKCLTRTEMENIVNAGLKIFYIFQESNDSLEAFNISRGEEQALKAIYAMDSLGAPENATIYFAVDFDPYEADIYNYIMPYFRGIMTRFAEENTSYNIGVYGTRNVCITLQSEFTVKIDLFVSDASYGFSGNLGFRMPSGWAFDQFKTDISIGTGNGTVSIDKVGVSGEDNGDYGPLRTPDHSFDPSIDSYVYKPTTEQKKLQGRLYVNMSDGLRVYSKIISIEDGGHGISEKFAVPHDEYLMYTLPKYAMYVNIGVMMDEITEKDVFNRGSYLIKFLDNLGNIQYGYIPVCKSIPIYDNYGNALPLSVSPQIDKDIENYKNQEVLINYFVDSTHTKLIPSSFTTIDNGNYYVYKLKATVQLYDASAAHQGSLPAGTQIALTSATTGSTHNELLYIYKVYNTETNKWETPLKSSNAFIEYRLEDGCMPDDRVINN